MVWLFTDGPGAELQYWRAGFVWAMASGLEKEVSPPPHPVHEERENAEAADVSDKPSLVTRTMRETRFMETSPLKTARRALRRVVAGLKSYGPSGVKRLLWDAEFSGGKWNFIDNTAGDCVYPHIERHGASPDSVGRKRDRFCSRRCVALYRRLAT